MTASDLIREYARENDPCDRSGTLARLGAEHGEESSAFQFVADKSRSVINGVTGEYPEGWGVATALPHFVAHHRGALALLDDFARRTRSSVVLSYLLHASEKVLPLLDAPTSGRLIASLRKGIQARREASVELEQIGSLGRHLQDLEDSARRSRQMEPAAKAAG